VVLWVAAAASTLWSGFPARGWEAAALLMSAAYAVGLTLWSGRAR
jgi:hypothetical protein